MRLGCVHVCMSMQLIDLNVMVGCEQASESADRDGEAYADTSN